MVPATPLFLMRIKIQRCLLRVKDPQLIDASSPSTHKPRYKKEIEQGQGLNNMQLNNGANKIEHQAPTLPSIDKFPTKNCHRV